MTTVVSSQIDGKHFISTLKPLLCQWDIRDLAELYGVETKVLKQAVRRNIDRFPADFMFELTRDEFKNLRSQIVTSSWGGQIFTHGLY